MNAYKIFAWNGTLFDTNASESLPKHAAHTSYVSFVTVPECSAAMELDSVVERCMFITLTELCQEDMKFINSMDFLFCQMSEELALGSCLLVILCVYFFLILGTTADKFFCPALTVISKKLNIGENVAGVTILAFGNGSPDLFTAISSIKPTADTELMFTELMGAAAFITTIVAGTIVVISPFVIEKGPFLRDVLFFMVSVLYIAICVNDGEYTLYEGIGTILIYLAYISVVIVTSIRLKLETSRLKKISRTSLVVLPGLEDKLHELEQTTEIEFKTRTTYYDGGPMVEDGLMTAFFKAIVPIDVPNFRRGNILLKLIAIIKAPIVFVLLLIIPVVDYGLEDGHGWCRLLNALHCVTLPMFVMFCTGTITSEIYGFSVCVIVLLVGLIFGLLVLFTSETNEPPPYHSAFAILAFIGSISTIFVVAGEVVSCLQTLGVVLRASHSVLGYTVLAYGNSVGDLFTNITLAKTGYTRMAFAACFGGPMFNVLFGIGIRFLLMAAQSPNNVALIREGAAGPNLTWFLLWYFGNLLILVALTNFQMRRSVGIFMLVMYLIFFVMTVPSELGIVHAFGTDHIEEREIWKEIPSRRIFKESRRLFNFS